MRVRNPRYFTRGDGSVAAFRCALVVASVLTISSIPDRLIAKCARARGATRDQLARGVQLTPGNVQLVLDCTTCPIDTGIVEDAAAAWFGACDNGGIPDFSENAPPGSPVLHIAYSTGIGPVLGECGAFQGNTITFYQSFRRVQNGPIQPCTPKDIDAARRQLTGELEHELGHYLGLGDVPDTAECRLDIMAPLNGFDHDIQSDECMLADYLNTVPAETNYAKTHDCDPATNKRDCYQSPLILLTDDAPYWFSSAVGGVHFDINGDGTAELTAWPASGNLAFLGLDSTGDGVINSGVELFGNFTPADGIPGSTAANGFEALIPYDSNSDGKLDALDPVWGRLLLWTDRNHDGICQPTEVTHVAGSGIKAISLGYSATDTTDPSGNQFRYSGQITWSSGAGAVNRPVWDVYLLRAPEGPVLYPPDANTDAVTVAQNKSIQINVLANDGDRNGLPVYLDQISQPTYGRAQLAGTQVIYTPNPGFAGGDSFSYFVHNGGGARATGLVKVTVNGEVVAPYGLTSDIPISGDWDGDGATEVGVFRPSNHTFYLASHGSYPGAVISFGYPNGEDVPIVGDWTGTGKSQVGIYRRSMGQFFLCLDNNTPYPGRTFTFGPPDSIPIAGYWNGRGAPADVGIFDPASATFTLRNSPVKPFVFGYGSDVPIVGDWNGDGLDDVGVFRGTASTFFLRNPSSGTATINYGQPGDVPVTGDWGHLGRSSIGFFRGNEFHLNTGANLPPAP